MKRSNLIGCAAIALCLTLAGARAFAAGLYGGHPFCKPLSRRDRCKLEEKRQKRFWHDWYDSQKRYANMMSRLDWVSYYKNHGQPINTVGDCGGCLHTQYAPVLVSPNMQWALPSEPPSGPPPAYTGFPY